MCFHSQYSYLENFKCSSRATLRSFAGRMWPAGRTLPRSDLDRNITIAKIEVSNSNPLKGRICYQTFFVGHTLKKKRLCGPQFFGEGSYEHISCQIWLYFFIWMALLKMFFLPKLHKNPNFSIVIIIPYIFLEERGPHRHTRRAACLRPLGPIL